MSYPRIPLYIGIKQSDNILSVLAGAGVQVYQGTHGGYVLRKGIHEALSRKLGATMVGGTGYRVYALLVTEGDPRRVYRWLKSTLDVAGPYTRHNAPNALKTFLAGLRQPGESITGWVCAGDDADRLDALGYTEGADPDGDDDVIAEV